MSDAADYFRLMDDLGIRGTPFLFVIDYDCARPRVWPLHELPGGVRFSVSGVCVPNEPGALAQARTAPRSIIRSREFVPYDRYEERFHRVQTALRAGESYLVNLTFPTRVELSCSLSRVYEAARAPYKLLLPGECVVFSPEAFVRIEPGAISTFPMKGTIDSAVPDAKNLLLADEKEAAEHATVVDLLRNDIGMVAQSVTVPRFRYVDRICLQNRSLFAVSSEIRGELAPGAHRKVGSILRAMLPAGSITGAPKKRTREIISDAELGPRGDYTGVFGVFDGERVESAVMIRFIEQNESGFRFHSGGGVTIYSECRREYEELRQKVDVPVA